MTFTRRSFLWQTAGALATAALLPKAAWAANTAQIKIGSCYRGSREIDYLNIYIRKGAGIICFHCPYTAHTTRIISRR